jgi:error-prone DNA polymerase
LPRLKPEHFYDLVVEVAISPPGPIVGNMVHPYLARRRGDEPVTYPHPSLEPVLKRTLGVPLFRAVAADGDGRGRIYRRGSGGCAVQWASSDPSSACSRSRRGCARMARNGITDAAADQIVQSITSFALYGFPESHAASFALIVYASAYLKAHFPAAFIPRC